MSFRIIKVLRTQTGIQKICLFAVSLLFVSLNYSHYSWAFFDRLGGLSLAKSAPEILGIVFFLGISKVYISRFYRTLKIKIEKKDVLVTTGLAAVVIIYHFNQFYTYFYKDDFYYWLNRNGTSYSVYKWGPWLSSHPGWFWETIRYFFGYSIFPYQFASLFSLILLGSGTYFLVKYLSKSWLTGIISAFLVGTTTITFEAFQWLSHPISYGWQGLVVCVSLMALVWETKQGKGLKIPFLSYFIFMAAFGAGIARIGFFLPLLSLVLVISSYRFLRRGNKIGWTLQQVLNLIPLYLFTFLFFLVRQILHQTATKGEILEIPFYKLYLYVVGIFIFPPEIIEALWKKLSAFNFSGSLPIYLAAFFIFFFLLHLIYIKLRGKKFPVLLSVGFFWLTLSALFYSLYAPHLPSKEAEILRISSTTHHLSFLGSVGALMIWGWVFYRAAAFLWRFQNPLGRISVGIFVLAYSIFSYKSLVREYETFLDIPKGIKISHQQFFFDAYRKYIPASARKINIYYDEGKIRRLDNYRPGAGYFRAFWDGSNEDIGVLYGTEDLRSFLKTGGNESTIDKVNNLYYIYTNYQRGLVSEDLSRVFRDNLLHPGSMQMTKDNLSVYWGIQKDSFITPQIIEKGRGIRYFKNPVVVFSGFNFPSILTPEFSIEFTFSTEKAVDGYVDLRTGLLSHFVNHRNLPTEDELLSLANDYFKKTASQNDELFNNSLKVFSRSEGSVCGQTTKDKGVPFLVFWSGGPLYTSPRNLPGQKDEPFFGDEPEYGYDICFSGEAGGKMNLELTSLGSYLKKIVIIPFTPNPVSVKIFNATLRTPQFLK